MTEILDSEHAARLGAELHSLSERLSAVSSEFAALTAPPELPGGNAGGRVSSRTPSPPHALYVGAQLLFKSNDRGQHWQIISPDLTGKTRTADQCQGKVAVADARECGFGAIFTIAPSPHDVAFATNGSLQGHLICTVSNDI